MGRKTRKVKKFFGFVLTAALATTTMVGTVNAETTTKTNGNEKSYTVVSNNDTVFTDVPKDHWSKVAIDYLAAAGIYKGYGNGKFGFGDNITRGQVASLVNRYLGLKADDKQGNMFSDITNHMFEKDIKAIAQAGIMKGDGTGTFRPDDVLTRYEMAVILQKAFHLEFKGQEKFKDVPKGHWAYEAVNTLRSNRIAQGDEAGNFNGNMIVKREQYAQFFYNAIAKNRDYNFNINSKEELKQMLTTALHNGTFGPFKLNSLGKDLSDVKKEYGVPDVLKKAPCTECDAPNIAVYGDYNIDMYPSDARHIWVKMDITINELKEWFGEPDKIGGDMTSEGFIYNRGSYYLYFSFSDGYIQRAEISNHEYN
ncbi:S-layer homology domain-containing protein [Bacillus sp. BLCC-B18]|uniref:S-layer homology domain-containing protein n=1 Tax=Bacillus sp. BLCC-B18 TaxID=3025368 RepID=UPI00234FEB90|nr:S-layer homology domain-containing protein [Bacillus sp. BLCC-B18]MDC7971340.1 S-layer homology domain-containing protein [Bacillus sp. BLCC-B18]